jgi:hypothetical protein
MKAPYQPTFGPKHLKALFSAQRSVDYDQSVAMVGRSRLAKSVEKESEVLGDLVDEELRCAPE